MTQLVPPYFSEEQAAIIRARRNARLLVIAGPGTGKTAVACARIDFLIGEGDVSPNRVLFISFTRTAVAELRQRILGGAVDESAARSVRISTIDSQAWRLRAGFGEGELPKGLSYDSNLAQAVMMLESASSELLEFLEGIDHVIVDEAQDVGDVRARFLIQLILRLSPDAGVTVFADPHQAIYGFSEEDAAAGESRPEPLLDRLRTLQPPFKERELRQVFRTSDPNLLRLLEESRASVAKAESEPHVAVSVLREVIARYGRDTDKPGLDDLKGRDDTLVLFRSRAQALLASSFLSNDVGDHRLRMSGLPTIASPWIAIVLSRVQDAYVGRAAFDELWQAAAWHEALRHLDAEVAWRTLFRIAGDAGRLHMPTLARVLARERPPVDLCEAEVGNRGPVISTIHASKGREAGTVRLMLKPSSVRDDLDDDDVEEEARVLYVAATRARESVELGKASHWRTETLRSGRVFSPRPKKRDVFVQIGCADDVDPIAHLCWPDADAVQTLLARSAVCSTHASATRRAELEHSYVVSMHHEGEENPIALFTKRVNSDLFEVRQRCGIGGPPPPTLAHLTILGCRTVGIPLERRDRVLAPFATSGIALAPVIKGFIKMGGYSGKSGRSHSWRK